MARQNVEFAIVQGPSKLDLMLSLFDTNMGVRTVSFLTAKGENQPGFSYNVHIISVRRGHPSAKIWEIEGLTETQNGKKRVLIYYLSDTREGHMRIEENLRTKGIIETPNNSRKAGALLEIIFRMINRYRESHSGNLDEEIFNFFEKAKRVYYAKDRYFLTRAIKNI
ncbi:MAG: hypothetical protein AAB343_00345 [Patescibacteria group bacterium]